MKQGCQICDAERSEEGLPFPARFRGFYPKGGTFEAGLRGLHGTPRVLQGTRRSELVTPVAAQAAGMPPVYRAEVFKDESQVWPFADRYNMVNFTTADTTSDRVAAHVTLIPVNIVDKLA